jgi:Subtilase family
VARDHTISLAGYRFDPLTGGPSPTVSLGAETQPDHFVVQFKAPLTPGDQERLRDRYGLRLSEYIPHNAYLERLSESELERVRGDPQFRAAVPFRSAFKVAPGLGGPPAEERPLRAVLFDAADPDVAARGLADAGAREVRVHDDRRLGGSLQIIFSLPSRDRLPQIAAIEEVRWIEEVAEQLEDNSNTAGTMQSGAPGVEPIWDRGLHGENQVVGVIDTPIDLDHCWFEDAAPNTPAPRHRKVVGFRNQAGAGGHPHGTFVAGIVAGDDRNNPGAALDRGNAWAARLTFGTRGDIGSGDTTMLEYLADAQGDGAAIHTNSWHEEPQNQSPARPQYNQTARDVDAFVWNNEDNLVLGSSGNVGEAIGPPGTAKNALCVSAASLYPAEMTFGDGNSGPTADDAPRRKPDLFAPGCSITSATSGTACGTDTRGCATSWATPAAAAAAAIVRQYYLDGWHPTGSPREQDAFTPSGALLKATLLNSTVDMTGIAGYPGDMEGWGLIRLPNALYFAGGRRQLALWDVRNADGLLTGGTRTHRVDLAHQGQPLKVTLVWSEPPAAAGADDPVVNDLDLLVTSPDGGEVYSGNAFDGGVSVPGGAPDDRNNVEMVLLPHASPGRWTIRVSGTAVNVGRQGYALVVTGRLGPRAEWLEPVLHVAMH